MWRLYRTRHPAAARLSYTAQLASPEQCHTGGERCLRRDEVRVVYFFRRGDAALSCETRLDPDSHGYQLVIRETYATRIENFDDLPRLLAREHELLLAWRAQGWRDVGPPVQTPVDPSPSRR